MKRNLDDLLSLYVESLYPIIYINYFDFKMVDELLKKVGEDENVKFMEYDNALGIVNFKTKVPEFECDLNQFLNSALDSGYDNQTFIILKDIHDYLNDPKVISLLRRISENNLYIDDYSATIFIISSKMIIPTELENYITVFDIHPPTNDEIINIIKQFAKDVDIEIKQDVIYEISLSFKGLSEFQIKQILNLAYQDEGDINLTDRDLILREKEQFVKKSGMLEMVNFKESINDIGGLEILKQWLHRKEKVFKNLDKAIKFGVDIPKGIMIVGMPGCGKSLTAKATAKLFEIPLIRLDIGRLLGKYVGESEENMRKALKLSEAIAPCVLWIDEIEKAFSGVGSQGGGSEVTTRLFGQFLTWMQEKDNTVFIVATANDISGIPPEFLRKGRFDELFFVDLPNEDERKKIIEIHIKKRNKWNKGINIDTLVKQTKGFNGADLESAIKDSIEFAFVNDKKEITTEDLLNSIKDTKSISSTLKDKIDHIRKTIEKIDIKSASKP